MERCCLSARPSSLVCIPCCQDLILYSYCNPGSMLTRGHIVGKAKMNANFVNMASDNKNIEVCIRGDCKY